jgi:hypothetical protein
MRPSLMMHNGTYVRCGDVELACQRRGGCLTSIIAAPHLYHLGCCELRTANPLPARQTFGMGAGARPITAGMIHPALCFGISDVIHTGAKKQMIRADTSPYVAMVTYEEPVRDRAIMDMPRYTMGQPEGAIEIQDAITATRCSNPKPASVRVGALSNVFPEAGDRGSIEVHGESPSLCLPRDVHSIAGAFCCPIIASGGANA